VAKSQKAAATGQTSPGSARPADLDQCLRCGRPQRAIGMTRWFTGLAPLKLLGSPFGFVVTDGTPAAARQFDAGGM